MNYNEYLSYQSEIGELESLLAEIPPSNLLERFSLEARLKSVKAEIEGIAIPKEPYKLKLTFRGKPVSGSHGITADFGSKAAGLFSEVITGIAAAVAENLQHSGPVRDKQKNQLLITGTTVGSFGFEYELPASEEFDSQEQSNVQKALKLFDDLLRCSLQGSDDDIGELMEEIHPRAIRKTAEFLGYVSQHGAWCSLHSKDRSFQFQSLDEISSSSSRLQENNIRESTQFFEGEFQGALPLARTFEFKCAENSKVIKGKIEPSVVFPEDLNRKYLHKHVQAELNITQIGAGKQRFSLMSLDRVRCL